MLRTGVNTLYFMSWRFLFDTEYVKSNHSLIGFMFIARYSQMPEHQSVNLKLYTKN